MKSSEECHGQTQDWDNYRTYSVEVMIRLKFRH
ncbi:hypothetical protein HNR71_005360 [Kribbella sandramycini]|uniref:Uncharacterized protein n=1 Tax=Kribbella sandramycini TaxID=60450 RepID=A0A841SJX1_9ACTN|nr:hypothetical protein [Kribbella sandramycini]